MSEYDKLKEEFDQKVKELQSKCKHEKTRWHTNLLDSFAPETLKVCENCDKVI